MILAAVLLGAVWAQDIESRLRVEPDAAVFNATTIAPELDVMSASAGAFAKDEAVGMSLAALAIFVAAGGGTGGGGVLDPIYILIMGLDAKVREAHSHAEMERRAILSLVACLSGGHSSVQHHDLWRR